MNATWVNVFMVVVVLIAPARALAVDTVNLLGSAADAAGRGDSSSNAVEEPKERAGNVVWRWYNSTSRTEDGRPSPGRRLDRVKWLLSAMDHLSDLNINVVGDLAALATSDADARVAIVERGLEVLDRHDYTFDEVLELCRKVKGRAGCRLAVELLPTCLESYDQLKTLTIEASTEESRFFDTEQKPAVLVAGVHHLVRDKGLPLSAETLGELIRIMPRWVSDRSEVACALLPYVRPDDDIGPILRSIESEMQRNDVVECYESLRTNGNL